VTEPIDHPLNRWRNRIVGLEQVAPDDLLANPYNHRIHSAKQAEALDASLDRLGWITPVIVNVTTQHAVDGHLRIADAISADEATVPVLYIELTEEEERIAIATFDAIAGMAGVDRDALAANVADLDLPSPLAALTDSLISPAAGMADAEGAAGASDKDTPNSLTWGYASWGDTKVESSTGEVDTLQQLWERYRRTEGGDEGFVAWLTAPRAAEEAA
jgi:hypothetical protein